MFHLNWASKDAGMACSVAVIVHGFLANCILSPCNLLDFGHFGNPNDPEKYRA